MKKERLVVMNGSKIVQVEDGPNEWRVEKVEKADGIRPNYYNLFAAKEAALSVSLAGTVLHVDAASIYQLVGQEIVRHERSKFDKVPENGAVLTVEYKQGRAVVSMPQIPKRARSR